MNALKLLGLGGLAAVLDLATESRFPARDLAKGQISSTGQGRLGERLVSEALGELPYWHVDNLIVPVRRRNGKTTQIDHVVASLFGLFVVETKHYRGAVCGAKDDLFWWEILGDKPFPFWNPLRQNQYHASVLADHLELPESAFRPVVVFVGGAKLVSPGLPSNVISTFASGVQLLRYIKKFDHPILGEADLSAAKEKLVSLKRSGLTLADHLRNCRLHSKIRKSLHGPQHQFPANCDPIPQAPRSNGKPNPTKI